MAHFIRQFPVAFAQEAVSPSNDRLLRGIRNTLQNIASLTVDQQSKAELKSIDAALGELTRRNQSQFYADYYREARTLLTQGLALLRPTGALTAGELAAIDDDLATVLPAAIDAGYSFDFIGKRINRVLRHIATLIEALDDGSDPNALAYLQQVTAFENEFQMHRAQYVQPAAQASSANAVTAESLEAYLHRKWPQRRGLRVSNFKQLVGGFQKVTILFDVEDDEQRHDSLVLRMGKDDKFVTLDFGDIGNEFELVSFLDRNDIRVAEPLLVEEDESALGNKFFISRKAPGYNLGNSNALSGMTDGIAKSFVQSIARVHQIPLTDEMRSMPLGRWMKLQTSRENALLGIEYWRTQPFMRSTNPSPILERLVKWLTDNIPQEGFTPCLVHCDYGPHNVLVHDGEVSAILDWESARIGDPAEDVSWFLQSCGGQVDYAKAIAWYQEVTGIELSEFRLRYFDVLGCLKTMVASGSAAAMYEAREDASIVWCDLHLIYTSYATRSVEERIRVAEAARK